MKENISFSRSKQNSVACEFKLFTVMQMYINIIYPFYYFISDKVVCSGDTSHFDTISPAYLLLFRRQTEILTSSSPSVHFIVLDNKTLTTMFPYFIAILMVNKGT